jgi:hypothetical protein
MEPSGTPGRDARALQAFHDSELGPLARWRFQRRLARSADLQRALRALEAVGECVRAGEAAVASPDLWQGIARGLDGIDAERAEAEWKARRAARWPLPWKPVSALVVSAAVLALAIGLFNRDTAPSGVVHWLDSGSRNVLVLDGERDVTVIWLLDSTPESTSRGGGRGATA